LLLSGNVSVNGTPVGRALVGVTGSTVGAGVTEVGYGCVDVEAGVQAVNNLAARMSATNWLLNLVTLSFLIIKIQLFYQESGFSVDLAVF
jgi:hypothetical protein